MNIDIISYMIILPAIFGAFIVSTKEPRRKQVFLANMLFFTTNVFSVIFMIINTHIGYIVLYAVYIVISIRGMYLNRGSKNENSN